MNKEQNHRGLSLKFWRLLLCCVFADFQWLLHSIRSLFEYSPHSGVPCISWLPLPVHGLGRMGDGSGRQSRQVCRTLAATTGLKRVALKFCPTLALPE